MRSSPPRSPCRRSASDRRRAGTPGRPGLRRGSARTCQLPASAASGAGAPDRWRPTQLQANLRHDTKAVSIAAAQLPEDQENEVGHALNIAGKGIDEEGRNLIGEKDVQG